VELEDRAPDPPQRFALDEVALAVRGLGHDRSGALELTATGPDGARLKAAGTVGAVPVSAALRVTLAGVALARYAAYLPPAPRAALAGGRGELAARVRYDIHGLRVAEGRIAVTDLALQDGERALLGVARAAAEGIQADLAARRLHVAALRAAGVRAQVRRDADGTLDLARALAPAPAPPGRPPGGETAAADGPGATRGSPSAPAPGTWHVTVDELAVTAQALRITDAAADPAVTLHVAQATLEAHAYDSAKPSPLPLTLTAALAGGGALRVQGALRLRPLGIEAAVAARHLPLPLAQPYLAAAAHLALRAGALEGEGKLAWHAGEPGATRFTGTLAVDGLDVRDTRRDAPLLAWESLRARDVDATPDAVAVGALRLVAPRLRYRITADGQSNLHGLRRTEGGGRAKTAPAAGPSAPPMPVVRVARLRVSGGTLDFADHTLPTPFAVTIEQLGGTVNALSTAPGTTTRLSLAGRVDGYAPARVEARVTPGQPLEAEFALRFRDVELATFSPYSGKFAGYRIRSGTLDLDLEYTVEGHRIAGRNRVVLDRLELGERVQSADATSLPVGLAIALLRDSRGVIDLDLPVRGSLADPQFDFRALIGKALASAVRKVVTAPFAFLARLVGGEEPPRAVHYPPGVATLAPRQVEALAPLAQALAQRPGLGVVVTGAAGREGDARALAAQRLGEAVDEVDEDEPWERIKALYEKRFGADPEDDLPEPPDGTEPTREERRAAAFAHARARLIGAFLPDGAALEALARARAGAVRDALIAAGVDGARVETGAARLVADAGADAPVETTLRLR
jgi:hypothetical protein